MSQTLKINALPGITAAKLFTVDTDTVVATASSVTAGTNDPSFYTIVFASAADGTYRLVLFIGSNIAATENLTLVDSIFYIAEVSPVIVLPVSTSMESRTVDGKIVAFVGEELEVSVGCDQTLTGLTLSVVVEDFSGADVGVISSVSVSSQTATFTVGSPYTDSVNQYRFSIRNSVGNIVVAKGILYVKSAASAD